MTGRFLLPTNAIAALCEDVSRYGALGVETGALLMCEPNNDVVRVLALVGTAGVTRRYGLFLLSMPVVDRAFTYAEDHQLRVRAQVHSHAEEAFLSATDQRGNLTMKGFTAAVIPTFQTPPSDPSSWGWWTFNAGTWNVSQPATVDMTSSAEILTVNADGAYAQ